jgi:colicin import membrane protein
MTDKSKKDKRAGVVGSTIFHGVLLILFMVLGLSSIPQEEEGILVDFGDSVTGMGVYEPVRNRPTGERNTPPPVSEPEPVTPPPATTPETSEEAVNTQDFEEQERKANEARNNVQNAFSRSDGRGSSQGETEGSGNQGQLSGEPGAGNYTGSGRGGSGSGFDLSGRSLSGNLPKPEYNIQEEGIVVVKIRVDKSGNVISAEPILKGTTTQNSYLWRVARQAAFKAQFNSDSDAPAYQEGTITYHFNLN